MSRQHYHYPGQAGFENQNPSSAFDPQSSNLFPNGNIPSLHADVTRSKTKRWVEAKPGVYDGDDWGAPEYSDGSDHDHMDAERHPTRDTFLHHRRDGGNAASRNASFVTSQSDQISFEFGSGNERPSSFNRGDEDALFTSADTAKHDEWDTSSSIQGVPLSGAVTTPAGRQHRPDLATLKALTPPERWIPSPDGKVIRTTVPIESPPDGFYSARDTPDILSSNHSNLQDKTMGSSDLNLGMGTSHSSRDMDTTFDDKGYPSTGLPKTEKLVNDDSTASVAEVPPATPSPLSSPAFSSAEQESPSERKSAPLPYQPSTPSRMPRSPPGSTPSPRANSSRPASPSKLRHVFTADDEDDTIVRLAEDDDAEPTTNLSTTPPTAPSSAPLEDFKRLNVSESPTFEDSPPQSGAVPSSDSSLPAAPLDTKPSSPSSKPNFAFTAQNRDGSTSPTRSRVRGIADQWERRGSASSSTASLNKANTTAGFGSAGFLSSAKPSSHSLQNFEGSQGQSKNVTQSDRVRCPVDEVFKGTSKATAGAAKVPGNWPGSATSSATSLNREKEPLAKSPFWDREVATNNTTASSDSSEKLNSSVLPSAASPPSDEHYIGSVSNAGGEHAASEGLPFSSSLQASTFEIQPDMKQAEADTHSPPPLNIAKENNSVSAWKSALQDEEHDNSQNITEKVPSSAPANASTSGRRFSWEGSEKLDHPSGALSSGQASNQGAGTRREVTGNPSVDHSRQPSQLDFHDAEGDDSEGAHSDTASIRRVRRQTNAMLEEILGDSSFSVLDNHNSHLADNQGTGNEEQAEQDSALGHDESYDRDSTAGDSDPETPIQSHIPPPLRPFGSGALTRGAQGEVDEGGEEAKSVFSDARDDEPVAKTISPDHSNSVSGSKEKVSLSEPSVLPDEANTENRNLTRSTSKDDPPAPPVPSATTPTTSTAPFAVPTSAPTSPPGLETVSKLPTFRQIMAIKSTDERIQSYQSVRSQFAKADTGLSAWVNATAAAVAAREDGGSNGFGNTFTVGTGQSSRGKRASFGGETAAALSNRITSWGSSHRPHGSIGGGSTAGGTISRLGLKSALHFPRIGGGGTSTISRERHNGDDGKLNAVDEFGVMQTGGGGGAGATGGGGPGSAAASGGFSGLSIRGKEKGKVILSSATKGAKGLFSKGKGRFRPLGGGGNDG